MLTLNSSTRRSGRSVTRFPRCSPPWRSPPATARTAPSSRSDGSTAPTTEPLATAGEAVGPDFSAGACHRADRVHVVPEGGGEPYKMDPQGTSLVRLTSAGARRDAGLVLRQQAGRDGAPRRTRQRPPRRHLGDQCGRNQRALGTTRGLTVEPRGPLMVSRWLASRADPGGFVRTWFVGRMDLAAGQLGIFNGGGGVVQGGTPYDPTGQKIVYISNDTSVDQVNAGGSYHKVLVTSTNGAGRSFSPDGKKIAFWRVVSTCDDGDLRQELRGRQDHAPDLLGEPRHLSRAGRRTGPRSRSPACGRGSFRSGP